MLRTLALFVVAFTLWGASPEDDIRKVLDDQSAAWNRGDIEGFMTGYANAADTTFVGKDVTRGGTAAVLARYQSRYPDREHMGTLTYSELSIRVLTPDLVLANGKYFLQRTAVGGGDASGRFTLVIRKTAKGWKIIHDHSS